MRSCLQLKLSLLLHISPFFLFVGCSELFYEPSEIGDAPGSPGSEWTGKPIIYPKEKYENPFTTADLSEEMSVALLLDIALFNNPSTRATWQAARASAYAYRVARSAYYPTISGSSTLTVENDTIGGSSGSTVTSALPTTPLANTGVTSNVSTASGGFKQIDTLFSEVNASWLMFDFGGRDSQVELAIQTMYAANWQHNFEMQEVMMAVLDNYTSYIGNKALVVGDQQSLQDAEKALKAAQVMKRAGLATMTDVLQAASTVEVAKTNLAQAIGSEKTSLGDLMISLGLPPATQVTVHDLPQKLPVIEISGGLESLLDLAKRKRPDLGAAIAAIKQQEAQLGISYSAGLPTLTASGQLSRLHFIHHPSLDGHDNNVSIALNVPLFQGFYYVNQQKQIRAQIEEALANLDVQISQVSTNVITSYYAFTSAAAALPSSEANLGYSQKAFQGYLAQYKVGTSSLLDVLNALTTLSNARSQLIVTRTQWASSLANLAFSVGILNDTMGEWKDAPPNSLFKMPLEDDNKLIPNKNPTTELKLN
jgi:outer membrane protein